MINKIRIGLGLVFILAGLYRIVFFNQGIEEFSALGLPIWMLIATIIIELSIAFLFFANKYVKEASIVLVLFLASAVAITARNVPLQAYHSIFKMSATPESILIHIIYIILLIFLITELYKKNKTSS